MPKEVPKVSADSAAVSAPLIAVNGSLKFIYDTHNNDATNDEYTYCQYHKESIFSRLLSSVKDIP